MHPLSGANHSSFGIGHAAAMAGRPRSPKRRVGAFPALDSVAHIDAINDRYYIIGEGLVPASRMWRRNSVAWAFDETGSLRQYAVNEPRRVPSPTGAMALLREPASMNMLLWSNDFGATRWTQSTVTVAPGATAGLGPGVFATASRLTTTPVLFGNLLRVSTAGYLANTTYCMWAIAKPDTANVIGLRPSGDAANAGDIYPYFNMATGVATTVTPRAGTINSLGMKQLGNGFWFCWVVFTTGAVAPSNIADVAITNASGATQITPAGTESVFLLHAQVEQQFFPTSPITTAGTTVTRDRDGFFVPLVTPLGAVGAQSQYIDCNVPYGRSDWNRLTSGSSVALALQTGGSFEVWNGVVAPNTSNAVAFGARAKCAYAGDGASRSVCMNAGPVKTDPSVVVSPQGFIAGVGTGVLLGQLSDGADGQAPICYVHEFIAANRRWADEKLIALTR